ncbi:hypothetical protein JW930_05145 [Candidatus Woesearchaeota archaeon]|nr:hypothetical protein [Candidatus Woesearchaeota archaeon]
MRITQRIIKEVATELVGEEAVPVVLYLKGKQHVSEFKVAADLKMDIHESRTILYRLYENHLATFFRRKDKQKGWYVCYWDYDPSQIGHLHKKIKRQRLTKLEERLEKEEGAEFYMCRNACSRMEFDRAFEFHFKCPECGEIMHPLDNKRTKEFLKERINELKKEIATTA